MDQTVGRTGSALQHSVRVVWQWWVLATTVGWVVLLALGFRVGLPLGESLVGSGPVGAVVGTLVGALILGTAQWLGLRSLLPSAVGWVVATVVGAGLGTTVGLLASGAAPLVAVYAGPVALGIALGVAQWLVLRPVVPRAGWWVLATAGSQLVGFLLYLLLRQVVDERGVVGLLFNAMGGLIYGVGTGLAWAWLVRADAPTVGEQRTTP